MMIFKFPVNSHVYTVVVENVSPPYISFDQSVQGQGYSRSEQKY